MMTNSYFDKNKEYDFCPIMAHVCCSSIPILEFHDFVFLHKFVQNYQT